MPKFAPMHVVITAATRGEWMPAYEQLTKANASNNGNFKVSFHQSGVGLLASAVSLTLLAVQQPSLIIQAGIAGCFNANAELGKVFVVGNEMLGDTGVDENNVWKDVFDLNLVQPNTAPFIERMLPNPWLQQYNFLKLPVVNSISINEITTSVKRKQQIAEKYNPFIESMEGAALHYTCRLQNIPFLQVRAISNYIGERDKANWKMKDAIVNLNNTLLEYIEKLNGFAF
jgi:futalosine hydrolase